MENARNFHRTILQVIRTQPKLMTNVYIANAGSGAYEIEVFEWPMPTNSTYVDFAGASAEAFRFYENHPGKTGMMLTHAHRRECAPPPHDYGPGSPGQPCRFGGTGKGERVITSLTIDHARTTRTATPNS